MNLSKYAGAPLSMPGVVNHKFLNASEAIGQFEAEQCNRQAVTARWLFDRPDLTGYLYLPGEADLGLDPWRVIDGVDALTDGSKILLEFGRTGEKLVAPDFEVYVSRKDAEREAAKEHEARIDRNPRTKAALDVPTTNGSFLDFRTRQVEALSLVSMALEEERAALAESLASLLSMTMDIMRRDLKMSPESIEGHAKIVAALVALEGRKS